ncbi:tRNA glutamyl-Q(34) synthetase GluQRS [Agrobacterium sp. ES01]|uniref:tRNA glutamyl-Q(34) synthetase GluQRS n=1 Tax=Agrobacterium sp. ES01 TaxID=3420714 RepID=UPI003D0E7E04
MIPAHSQKPAFRFAPSPNGLLHLGHAYSAILNYDLAKEADGRFLLRMEDIDIARCTPEFEAAIFDDMSWLGLRWEKPVRRQSEHLDTYKKSLERLIGRGLAYPAFMTRGEVKACVAEAQDRGMAWPRDPDGAPHYPLRDRHMSADERNIRIANGARHAWRLDMRQAIAELSGELTWQESGDGEVGTISADPAAWGDVVLWRSDAPASYHLSVVLDDADQEITHVVRGLDLFHATSVHRLLQELMGLPQPTYHHHRLILAEDGRKLSKSEKSTGLSQLRTAGLSPAAVRRLLDM